MTAGASPRAWRVLLAASVAAVGVADAVVLELTRGYFGSGFNVVALHGAREIAAFFAGGALLDFAGVGAVWCAVLGAARLLGARPLRSLAAAALLGIALPLAWDLVVHRLHRVLGDVLRLSLLLDLAAGDWRNALGEAAQDAPPLTLLGVAGGASVLLGMLALARAERASPHLVAVRLPALRALVPACIAAAALGTAALAWSVRAAPALAFGWSDKPAGSVLRTLVSAATDFDRDGFGWLSEPSDPAPFDGRIHPYALDVPGNGVDEDGVGGDLPPGFAVPQPVPVPAAAPRANAPSVVLIFLESFRADLIGLRDRGREVTPVLNALARSGTHATAYAHMPLTWNSRGSLLQGRVQPTADGATLVDDFLARGYQAAWFSGQHDGLASDAVRLGIDRVSPFFDARADVDRRTSRSAQPISLQVSWRTVLSHVSEFIEKRADARPLFLYVNLVDTHFPYWHPELDDLLGTGELPRESIRPENRERVWRAYLNAAANVDAAVGRVLALAHARLGPQTLVVVTGDHGQSFYEDGLLGHGQSVDDAQSAVPFLVSLPGAVLPSPLGMSDVRGLIGDWLDGAPVPAASRGRPEIFQHVGVLEQPLVVALRGRTGVTEVRPGAPREPLGADALRAVRTWETLALEASKAKRRRP